MPVRVWKVKYAGEVFGADGADVIPAAFAGTIAEHAGKALVTYYGKPYVLRADDPQSVYDYFDTEIDPHGDRLTVQWDYLADEADSSDVTP